MALIDVTQLVEGVVLPSVAMDDIINHEALPQGTTWVIDATDTRDDATALLQAGIIVALSAYGINFLGLREQPNDRHFRTHKTLKGN